MQREVMECSVTSRFLRHAADLVGRDGVVEVGAADGFLGAVAVGTIDKSRQI